MGDRLMKASAWAVREFSEESVPDLENKGHGFKTVSAVEESSTARLMLLNQSTMR